MLPLQPTSSTTTERYSLIDRVLHLRRQLGIDLSLSIRDSEDALLGRGEHQSSSMDASSYASSAYDCREWLAWSQSPCQGKLPEKGQEEL